jgi:proline iminopeptidase
MKTLYPQIEPFHSFFLQTETTHSVYVEQSGNAQGIPIIFLHGGPCSGTKPGHRRFFNPEKYHIILMDQRGCGLSLPYGEVENNTTQDLIADMERIRKQLNIERWLLFGGSWGSALTLLYTQKYSEYVLGMVIRGVFLARQKDLDWFAKEGAGRIFPELWQQLLVSVPVHSRSELVKGLYDVVFGQDQVSQRRAAKAWINWGGQVALMDDFQDEDKPVHVTEKMVQQVQMEMHYAHNKYFIAENQILNACDILQEIPAIIVHGRNDLVCPMEAGMSLHKVLPKAEYIVLPNAGHIAGGDKMIDALVAATDKMIEWVQ